MRPWYQDEAPRSPRFRFGALSRHAQIAAVLGCAYLLQLVPFLVFGRDVIGGWLGLRAVPLHWAFPVQLFGYGLVHAVADPFHVTWNALGVFIFGGVFANERGPRTMVLTFVLGIACGGLAYSAMAWLEDSSIVLVGASGGVFALLVAAAICAPHLELIFRIPLWVFAAVYVGVNLILFAQTLRLGTGLDPVSHVAHLGGAVTGLGIALRGVRDDPDGSGSRLLDRGREALARYRARRVRERAERLDAILEKIHEKGIASLSRSERRFLEKVSNSAQEGQRSTRPPTKRRHAGSSARGPRDG